MDSLQLVMKDVASACASAAVVAPAISIIDKAIFLNASGKEGFSKSIPNSIFHLIAHPLKFCSQASLLLIFGVYSSTYIAANICQTYCDLGRIPWQTPKFVVSSATNVTLSVLKDWYFTRLFGVGTPKPVPFISNSMYTIRDSVTIYASFILPPKVSIIIQQNYGISPHLADTTSQLLLPCVMQCFTAPLHLYGMNVYNVEKASFVERWAFIRKEYLKTTAARIGIRLLKVARIFPAFGVAGVLNKKFRSM